VFQAIRWWKGSYSSIDVGCGSLPIFLLYEACSFVPLLGLNMSIKSLLAILPPPASPNDAGVGKQWPLVDGVPFPSDYLDFINVYGSGKIADFLVVFNPFSCNKDVNFFGQMKLILADFNDLVASEGDYFDYPLYPLENGLMPVGVTDNGDYLFWVVTSKNDSDLWRIAIIASRSPDVEYFSANLTSVLEGVLTGRIKSSSLPDFLSAIARFESI